MHSFALSHCGRVSQNALAWSPLASAMVGTMSAQRCLRSASQIWSVGGFGLGGLGGRDLGSGSMAKFLHTGGSAMDFQSRMGGSMFARFDSPPEEERPPGEPRAAAMRRLLASPGVFRGPACYDALSARMAEKAGYRFIFMNGFGVAASRLAMPDTGLISYGEMVEQGRLITGAVSIPVVGDADNGYGCPLNVKRTVKGYINTGFAGIVLEDQTSPKACGHHKGRKVVSREDAVLRIKAAVDARSESKEDIVIFGRTDARQSVSLNEALWRVQAFADAGADVLFIDALINKEEMQTFANVAPGVPKMVNLLEGGGKTPITSAYVLDDMGIKLICYPLSLIAVSMRAMENALKSLSAGRIPPSADLPCFDEIKDAVGFPEFYKEEQRYSMPLPSSETSYSDSTVRSNVTVDSETPLSSSPNVPHPGRGPEKVLHADDFSKQIPLERSESAYGAPYVREGGMYDRPGNFNPRIRRFRP
eukprot:c26022_g1_i1 orf=588-2015(-)